MLSSVETADQMVTLEKEGILGSWEISSRRLMALAALTAIDVFSSCSIAIASLTSFLIFLGVIVLSATCCRVAIAFSSFSWFSFFFLALKRLSPLDNSLLSYLMVVIINLSAHPHIRLK